MSIGQLAWTSTSDEVDCGAVGIGVWSRSTSGAPPDPHAIRELFGPQSCALEVMGRPVVSTRDTCISSSATPTTGAGRYGERERVSAHIFSLPAR